MKRHIRSICMEARCTNRHRWHPPNLWRGEVIAGAGRAGTYRRCGRSRLVMPSALLSVTGHGRAVSKRHTIELSSPWLVPRRLRL